jgi:biopolymer transport protein ExbD
MRGTTAIVGTAMLLAGCATLKMSPPTFEQAVLSSINATDDRHQVVVVVDKDGAITVAGRPTTLEELERTRSVVGLPENPPAALIRGHREAKHADVRAVLDALSRGGIWRISFIAFKEGNEVQNQASQAIGAGAPQPER